MPGISNVTTLSQAWGTNPNWTAEAMEGQD